jgi:hypothetical protein
VRRSHDVEVATIDRGKVGDAQPFGCGNDRCVDGAER